jgi:flagella basal body P-ring formation protein FlgA
MMKALLFVCALAATASADPVDAIIRARLAPVVPVGFGIAKVHLPAVLASLDVAPASVTVEVPGELKLGRPSIKVTVKGKRTIYVPVTVGKMTEVAIVNHAVAEGDVLTAADLTIEDRATDIKAPAPAASLVGATMTRSLAGGTPIQRDDVVLAPPLARGTQVAIVMHHGSVRVRGTATLEAAARPGQEAVVRVGQTRTLVRGLLVAPNTVIVGKAP